MTAVLRAYRQAYAGLPREAWLLALVIFVNRSGTMVLPFLALYLKTELGYSAGRAGAMLAVYGLGGIVGSQLGGRLTQRWGGVNVAFLGLALSVPSFLAIPWCSSFPALIVVLLCLSIPFEAMRPAIATATAEFCPPELHSKAFALNRLAMNLGMSVGPAVGGWLAYYDYHLLFVVNGCFAGASAVVTAWSFGLHRREQRAVSKPSAPKGRSPWQDRTYLSYLGLQLASAIVFFQLLGALPMFWKEQWSLNEVNIGVLWAINTLLVVALEMVLTDRLSGAHPLRMVAWGTGLFCVGFGASAFGSGFGFACVLVLVWTMGEILSAPFALTYIAQRSEGGARGEYMGLFSTTMSAAFVLGLPLGAYLYDLNPLLPWWCCLAMAVVLPYGFWRLSQA